MNGIYALIGLSTLLLGVWLGVDALMNVDNLKKSSRLLAFSMVAMLVGGLAMGYWGALAVFP